MLLDRIMGVLRLDANTFEEIEADRSAIGQAALVVTIVALLSGIGDGITALNANTNFLAGFLATLFWAFLSWFIWAAVTYWVGTSLFDGQADIGEMLRVLGFAQAPRVLGVLSFIPCVGWLIALAAGIWSLIAAFIAIRQGLDLDSTKALFTAVIGWLVIVIGQALISTVFAGAALGIGALLG